MVVLCTSNPAMLGSLTSRRRWYTSGLTAGECNDTLVSLRGYAPIRYRRLWQTYSMRNLNGRSANALACLDGLQEGQATEGAAGSASWGFQQCLVAARTRAMTAREYLPCGALSECLPAAGAVPCNALFRHWRMSHWHGLELWGCGKVTQRDLTALMMLLFKVRAPCQQRCSGQHEYQSSMLGT